MKHEINDAFRLLYKGTFCNTKLLPVEVVLGLFLPKHCTIGPERATLNLAGIKEKIRTLSLPSRSLTIKQVIKNQN